MTTPVAVKPVEAWGIVGPDGVPLLATSRSDDVAAWAAFDLAYTLTSMRAKALGYRAIPLTIVPRDAGYAVVPVEPTEAMKEAGARGLKLPNRLHTQRAASAYRAMLAAAEEKP